LADERIVFMSNRSRSSMQCNQGQHEIHPSLYACDPDGSHLERLDNNLTGDYNPRLLDDGRIGYMRWEYNERSFNNPHAFWVMRPDGTYPEPVFGQHLSSPIMHTNPGTSRTAASSCWSSRSTTTSNAALWACWIPRWASANPAPCSPCCRGRRGRG
jgi:hypothetical protein